MKVFKLLYNSFIWGIIVAILAFQSEWLEMRVNIGIFVPLVMALCLIIRILLRKVKKENLLELSLKGTIINLLVCIAISLGILGVERIQVVPASILREGLKATSLSFNSVNMIILLIVIGGLVFFLFNNEEVEMKNIF